METMIYEMSEGEYLKSTVGPEMALKLLDTIKDLNDRINDLNLRINLLENGDDPYRG